jgi:hypothetical protein
MNHDDLLAIYYAAHEGCDIDLEVFTASALKGQWGPCSVDVVRNFLDKLEVILLANVSERSGGESTNPGVREVAQVICNEIQAIRTRLPYPSSE